jgi:hypothetical protein
MKKTMKDIGNFAMGSIAVGATSAAVGKAFPSYAGGMEAVGSMMPVVGGVMMASNITRMSAKFAKTGRPYNIKKGKLKGILPKGF